MRHTKYDIRHTRYEHAFTVVELLLALAITGILLAAVAVAFNASIMNYRENEDIFKTINSARQALCRITSQLRTAGCEVAGVWGGVDPTAPDNQCNFWIWTGTSCEDITYEFRSADSRLYLITNSDGQEYVLCDNVTAMSFIKTPTDDGSDCKSVQISMTVESGDIVQTVSSAAVVRRNLK